MARLTCTLLGTAVAWMLVGPAFAREPSTFADLDTDADGYLSQTDLPAGHELSLRFALADTDADTKLSQAEFEAYGSTQEEEEAE